MLQVPIHSRINPTPAVSGGGGDRSAPEQMAVEQVHCNSDVAARSLIEAALKYATYQIHILHPGFSKKLKKPSLTSPGKLAKQSSFMKSIIKGLKGFHQDEEAGPRLIVIYF